jgi:hypothetical protein
MHPRPRPTIARRTVTAAVLITACAVGLTSTASPALAAVSYKNCTELHRSYPHGIGKAGAKDKTTGKPVTTFKKDTKGYNLAIKKNRDLDRDKDGIACEKR